MSRHRRKSRRAAVTAIATVLAAAAALGIGAVAQAGLVKGTVIGGQGNYSTVNERVLASLSARISGQAAPGDRIPMICRTTGDTVENDNRWIWSGAYYIADAFISEDTGNLPLCSSTRPTSWTALDITMQKQVQDEWCWDASGLTVATYWGYNQYNQYDFCRLAQQGRWLDCNDRPATLDDMANGLSAMGFRNSGYDLNRNASFSEVTNEIANGRPFAVRIGWTSGGGHMNVIYGYDSTSNMIAVGDPWPSTQTYTWWNFNTYASNGSFQWTHSRVGIHA
ncbi:papain-like cysteine protease family protein [Kitasatospora cathayae]|uniref:C39 family peptidase n=1 Tax=Kitasatospora cathayae TaxID=3004092 RepID=A0ABY7PWV9_9ACTN|nr:papain-like cysteine protease family protein [Kitasatospora sp. HUAS 3-15]WBP84904.1 C39 family peptidase [Kitasatospora sp. HUAS 3-15]